MKELKLTDEQEAYALAAKAGQNIGARARAGVGKTTLQKAVAALSPRKKHELVVFNAKNAHDTNKDHSKPKNLNASTFHSFCLKQLRNVDIQGGGYRNGKRHPHKMDSIISSVDAYDIRNNQSSEVKENFEAAKDLVSLVKNSVINPTFFDVANIANSRNISCSVPRDEFFNDVLNFVKQSDQNQKVVDFDDMIRFCVLLEKGRNIMSDMFVVDEYQDNTWMRTLLMKQIAENTQIGFIGDDRQSIYYFAGAESDGFEKIKDLIKDVEMFPITINFRCDKNIIREAQKLVPDIRYHEDKEDGIVTSSKMEDLKDIFLPGDVGIARYNRIIISQCFRFIRDGKPATIQGADFGSILKAQVESLKATSIPEFYEKLDMWYDRQCEFYENEPSDAIVDRFECLRFLADNSPTVEKIADTISNIFKDETRDSMYLFSTGHKSKGLEWDRVHILDAGNFKAKKENMNSEQLKQEENLFYIAKTRARHYLNHVYA